MAITIQVFPALSPRIVEIRKPTTDVTVQEIYDAIRNWEDEPSSMSYPPLISGAGKEDLGGGVTVGITATLQNAQVRFEGRTIPLDDGIGRTCDATDAAGIALFVNDADFITSGIYAGATVLNDTTNELETVTSITDANNLISFPISGVNSLGWTTGDGYLIWPNVIASITGGNLVAVDNDGVSIDPVFQSPNVQVVRSSSSSATLQELSAIQYSSFNGGVTVDVISGNAGTGYPQGTPEFPVDNMIDAESIAVSRGFDLFHVIGDLTLSSVDFSVGRIFTGQSIILTTIAVNAGANVANCEFLNCTLTGVLDGGNTIRESAISTLNYVNGLIDGCLLNSGTIMLAGTEISHILNCESGVAGTNFPNIDMGGDGPPLVIRNYAGGIGITNKSGTNPASIDLNSGEVSLDATVTEGTIVIRGVGKLTDNSVGATIFSEDLLNKDNIADAIWSESVETGISTKEAIQYLLATLAGEATGGGTSSIVFKNSNGDSTRVTMTVDAVGDRSAITLNP